ncbi:MAG: SDR family oxidoreductase [Balneolaceae bacterium]
MYKNEMIDKVVIITGGGGAIGGAIAEKFVEQGARIVLLGRTLKTLEEKANEIQADDSKILCLSADVLVEEDLKQAKEQILQKFGTIDVLINAAGGNMKGATIAPDETVFDLQMDDFKKVNDLNLMGTVLPSMIFGEVMAEKKEGSILNISSMAADRVITRVIGYSASKAGMENFTKSLSVEMALKFGEGIRVNALAPGFFIGEQNRDLLTNKDGSYTERGNTIIEKTPMKRFGKVEEVAGAALFLSSDQAKFITGVVLPVDGGFSAFSGV